MLFDVAPPAPPLTALWEALVDCMQEPDEGRPHRPEAIHVCHEEHRKAFKSDLAAIGIECAVADDFASFGAAADQMLAKLVSTRQPSDWSNRAEELAQLPQDSADVWQVGVGRVPTWVQDEGRLKRPWAAFAISRTHDLILAQDMHLEAPDAGCIWPLLSKAIGQPVVGEPHRPAVVQVRSADHARALRPHLQAIGVDCLVCKELGEWDTAFEGLSRHFDKDDAPPLVGIPGIRLDAVAGYFAAAADYYRRAPWRLVPGDAPIKMEGEQIEGGPWYAVVMGQSGLTLGLAIYDELEALRSLLRGDRSDAENARRTWALSHTYGEAFEIPVRDLDAAERHGWPIAGPEAYPTVLCIRPGYATSRPGPQELELMEGCLRAIPEFLSKAGMGPQSLVVPSASGPLTFVLSRLDHRQERRRGRRGLETADLSGGK